MSSSQIVIVEDNDDDFEALEFALADASDDTPDLVRFETGEEALEYLRREETRTAQGRPPPPAVVYLDLNLPGIDGHDVLAAIKSDRELRMIPVIVLTTSSDRSDIDRCYRTGANSYLVKPLDMTQFLNMIVRVREYWHNTVSLPSGIE